MPYRRPVHFSTCLRTRRLGGLLLGAASLLGLAAGGLSQVHAAAPYLVMDIHPGSGNTGSNPVEILAAGDLAYFVAGDAVNGYQVRQTDGTTAGTRLIRPRGENVSVDAAPNGLARLGSTIFYSSGGLSSELWKTDGTAEGTMLVKDLNSVTGSSPGYLTPGDGVVYFIATENNRGTELYRSDGSAAGTSILKDICPGSGSSYPQELTMVGNTLYFVADDGVNGRELWKSDGTPAGTVMVKAIAPTSNQQVPVSLTAFGGKIYFIANDGVSGTELWASDGTAAGTSVVKDINPGVTSSFSANAPGALMVAGDAIYFSAYAPGMGLELWKSDGSEGGTVMVKDLNPGAGGSNPKLLGAAGSRLFFATNPNVMGVGWSLCVTDGTAGGTKTLPDINPGVGITIKDYEVSGNLLYFSTADSSSGVELWRSDGSPGGTFRVADICPGSASSTPTVLTAFKDGILFAADDGVHGVELWKSNGTAAGTMLVCDVDPAAASSLAENLSEWVVMGQSMYFAASDGAHGSELWRSDGTAAGTVMVADVNPGAANAGPTELTVVGDTLFFMAYSPGIGKELWKTDGTAAGTVLVKEITPGPESSSVSYCVAYQGKLYFKHDGNGVNGQLEISSELWRSDGTDAGTEVIKDASGGLRTLYSGPGVAGDYFWFAGISPTYGTELWRSDGTTDGTRMVQDSAIGQGDSIPRGVTLVGKVVCYFAETPLQGVELWVSNGIASAVVKDIYPGTGSSNASASAALGNIMLFSADDGMYGKELWSTDGTAANTHLVRDTLSGSASGSPLQFTIHGDRLYFTASTPTFSLTELWKSDGTSSGTTKVRQVSLGGPRTPLQLVDTPERLYFLAKETDAGPFLLWSSDGSSAGTTRLPDQLPGQSMGARVERMFSIPGKILMLVSNVEYGRELWALDLNPRIALELSNGQGLPSTGARLEWNPDPSVPDTKTIVIRNEGQEQLQGLQVRLDPPDAAGYQLSTAGMAASLTRDGTTTFTITRKVPVMASAPVVLRVSSATQQVAPVELKLLPWVNIPVASWDAGTLSYNPQTGAYELVVTLLNPGAHTLANFAVQVANLPAGMTLRGGTASGGLLADVGALAPGATALMTLRFDLAAGSPAPELATFAPEISMLPTLPVQWAPPPFAIDQFERTAAGGVVLGFPSLAGHHYRVEYSADSEHWTPVPELIEAGGNRVQWTDEGPPQTVALPGESNRRFYRVVEIE
ncbi:ELWxxDGT repeat protein [Haloferula sp. BvORR071]|uniref:ELWxxDGT repeat protein n=1 Tax=Haloferula sp. BvORR071 TaxID=1396141 RepID=UPI000696CF3B|nr:ELWxxDGT repeat protein [Haloferula sp. BvORR071]